MGVCKSKSKSKEKEKPVETKPPIQPEVNEPKHRDILNKSQDPAMGNGSSYGRYQLIDGQSPMNGQRPGVFTPQHHSRGASQELGKHAGVNIYTAGTKNVSAGKSGGKKREMGHSRSRSDLPGFLTQRPMEKKNQQNISMDRNSLRYISNSVLEFARVNKLNLSGEYIKIAGCLTLIRITRRAR
jgi:hypothetical protein